MWESSGDVWFPELDIYGNDDSDDDAYYGIFDYTLEERNRGGSELCLVCLENDATEWDRRSCCDQAICQLCLEKYVRSKLNYGVVRIGCPNADCDGRVQVKELARLDRDLVRVYHSRLVDANLDPHRKTCPNCCLVTEVEPNDHNESKYGLVINCVECQFRWCFQCHGPQHRGVECRTNRAKDDMLQKWARRKPTIGTTSPTAQQCPVCKIYVERTSGCPHMECRMCESEFCYNCGDRWHDSHLDNCPKASCEEGKSRDFRRLRKKLRKGGIIGGAVVGGVILGPLIVGVAVPVALVAASVYGSYRVVHHVKRRRASDR